MRVDSFTTERWLGMSFWRPLSADSVEIHWRNGLYGPVMRLSIRGDSLRGRTLFTTDVIGDDPLWEPAVGVRIGCPR